MSVCAHFREQQKIMLDVLNLRYDNYVRFLRNAATGDEWEDEERRIDALYKERLRDIQTKAAPTQRA